MKDPYLLHIFTPAKNVSPFDVNMAYEAQFDGVIPYTNITIDEITTLVQDMIFSRRRKTVRRSMLFISGRDPGLAMDMIYRARSAMFEPFEVSIFADPGGAFTTSAAVIATIERLIKLRTGGRKLAGEHVAVLGGTGPVGVCCGVLAARLGAVVTLLSSRGQAAADQVAEEYNQRCDVKMMGGDASTRARLYEVLGQSEVIIAAARAGLRVLDSTELQRAPLLTAAVDVNAVPPLGIGGLRSGDFGVRLEATRGGALGAGALAVGNIKFQVHRRIFEIIKESEQILDVEMDYALGVARRHVPEDTTSEEEQKDL